ncbi:hypothetical protein NHJ13051_006112 [Beauveria bassiana]
MNPNRSSVPSTRRTKSTNATSGPPKVKRSSAYDRDFEQKLTDCNPDNVGKAVRQDLNKTIIPTTHSTAPVVPNFFLEAKAPRGGADVAKRQACLDGALGARAMHTLQAYGEETPEETGNPIYDGNAYVFSSTYHDGTLKIYTHHVTAPTAEGSRPGYHMTQVRTFGMTDTRETFIAGATAIRNARDLARQRREDFLQAAKAKVSQQQPFTTVENGVQLQGGHLVHGSPEDSENEVWQDAHDDLQQHIAETHSEVNEEHDDAPVTPQQQSSSDSSDDSAHHATASVTDNSSTSFVSSLTSNSNTDSTRPKRSRPSASSPTQGSRSPKSRSRFTTNRNAALREPGPSESVISYWIQTYGYEEKVLFRNPEGQEIETDLKDWKQETINGAQYFYWQCPKSGRVFGAKEWPGVEKN